jgi:hypothetical protein
MMQLLSIEEIRLAIHRSFAHSAPPDVADVLMPNLAETRPFEAAELTSLLLGKDWRSITGREIEEHPDWLVYLSPMAFGYYLPAWLLHALASPHSYASQFVSAYVDELPEELKAALSYVQRYAIAIWRRGLGEL